MADFKFDVMPAMEIMPIPEPDLTWEERHGALYGARIRMRMTREKQTGHLALAPYSPYDEGPVPDGVYLAAFHKGWFQTTTEYLLHVGGAWYQFLTPQGAMEAAGWSDWTVCHLRYYVDGQQNPVKEQWLVR